MNGLRLISQRLARSDLLQLATLFFAVLFFSFTITWPSTASASNDTWFSVAQARILCLGLLALGYGSALLNVKKGKVNKLDLRVAIGALMCLALLSAPVEVMSYALSYPSLPLPYSLGLMLLDTYALFGIGMVLGRLLGFLRLRALLPLAVPAVLVGLIMADLALGLGLFNPLSALSQVALPHLATMATIAVLTSLYLFTPSKAQPSKEPAQ